MHLHYLVPGDDFSQAGNASAQMKKILQQLGLPSAIIKRTSVAMRNRRVKKTAYKS